MVSDFGYARECIFEIMEGIKKELSFEEIDLLFQKAMDATTDKGTSLKLVAEGIGATQRYWEESRNLTETINMLLRRIDTLDHLNPENGVKVIR